MVAKVIAIVGIVVISLLRAPMGGAEAGHDPVLQQAIELFNAKRYSASQAMLVQ
jgi:tetratricopeptide (TPR) repeat protein